MEWMIAATILATYSVVISIFSIGVYRYYRKLQSHYMGTVTQMRSIEASYTGLEMQVATLQQEVAYEREQKQQLMEERRQLEQQNIVLHERTGEMERRMQQWEKAKEESMANAKAAIFEVGSVLAKDLIAKHQQQQDVVQKNQEVHLKQTTEALHLQFQQIVRSVSVLNEEVKRSGEVVDVVRRALLSPTGAGQLAEITLENLLKASGLMEGKDFVLQHTLYSQGGEAKLRPDAIVYLPGGQSMIIDSKASKFFVELVQANEGAEEAVLKKKLSERMLTHMKALADKDYKAALMGAKKEVGKRYISTVMFLPSDQALDTLLQIDSEFMHKAWDNGIFPVGPAGLINILAHARFHIVEMRQAENFNTILEEVGKLLSTVGTLQEHSARLGKSLQGAMQHYDKFAGSFNSSFLQKAKKIEELGVDREKRKALHILPLERYTLVQQASNALVELVEDTITEEN